MNKLRSESEEALDYLKRIHEDISIDQGNAYKILIKYHPIVHEEPAYVESIYSIIPTVFRVGKTYIRAAVAEPVGGVPPEECGWEFDPNSMAIVYEVRVLEKKYKTLAEVYYSSNCSNTSSKCAKGLPLEEVVRRSDPENSNYPDIFKDTVGLSCTEKGYKAILVTPTASKMNGDGNRRVELCATCLCFDNMSVFYGTLIVQGVFYKTDSGFMHLDPSKKPHHIGNHRYTLPLKNLDPDTSSTVEYFTSEDELVEFAKLVFSRRFTGRWSLYYDNRLIAKSQ